MSDGLHDYHNFRPFLEKYAGREATFEYQGSGLVSVALLDESDGTVIDDDEIFDLMGHEAYHQARCYSPVQLVLKLKG